jgi:hypothetical protein
MEMLSHVVWGIFYVVFIFWACYCIGKWTCGMLNKRGKNKGESEDWDDTNKGVK